MLNRLKQLWHSLRNVLQKKQIRQLIYLGIVLISIAFIAYAIKTNWAQLKSQEWHINAIYAVLAVLLYPLGMIPAAAAWHWLLRAFNKQKPFLLNLRLYAISSLPKHIPGLVWYITSRTLLYEENGINADIILMATATETLMLAMSGFISAILIFSLRADLPDQFAVLRYLAPLSIIGLVMLFVWAPGGTRLLDKLFKRWRKDDQSIVVQRSALLVGLGWMFLAWVGGGFLLWLLIRAISPISLELLPMMIGIWGAASAISLTIGIGIQGLGLRELTLAALLSLIITPIIVIIVAVAFRLVLIIGEFLWVFLITIFIRDKHIAQKKAG
jgi:hypothetical protein